jgi:iron only hydrogenase large subunit-like protein
MQNCPYHAIIKIPVPCEEACPVDAISKNENGKEQIDYGKCISCGACMRNCPFGAMMAKSQVVDVVKHIMSGKHVAALYAPAVAAQFRIQPGQMEAACLAAGFDSCWEVALGADVTSANETREFEERMARGEKMMTTSCCPAYVQAVKLYATPLVPCISGTGTPAHYTAELAKKADPDCVTVFIGPCVAKMREGMDDSLIDYVISVAEIQAIFAAKDIDLAKITAAATDKAPSAFGRNYARSGGVTEAIKAGLKDPSIARPAVINGLNKAGIRQLIRYGDVNSGKIQPAPDEANLIEVMACEGGCIGGPLVVSNPKVALAQLARYSAPVPA